MSPHVFGQDSLAEIHTDYAHERIDELERRVLGLSTLVGMLALAVVTLGWKAVR